MKESQFVRGNDRISELLANPERAANVKVIQEQMRTADAAYGETLATVRKASALTQNQLAERLGVSQGAISQLENKPDMLLSTLRNYLIAAGAERPRLLVDINGTEVNVAL